MFALPLTIGMQHTDAYGLLFYPNQTAFCHAVFQAWLEAVGHPLPPERSAAEVVAVVRHLESDYLAPVRLGDHLVAELRTGAVGTTSFTLDLRFRKGAATVGTCRVVMVCTEARTGTKRTLPGWLDAALTANVDG